MPPSAPMKTDDGRFSFEAAGDAGLQPLVFLHGIGGAARAWRSQLEAFGDRYHAVAWDMPGYGGSSPLAHVGIATLAGMIVQQWLIDNPDSASAVVLAQTSPAFGKTDGDWQRSFIEARLGPLDRGESMASLAPNLVRELVGDDPDPEGMEIARDCMASVPEASYRASMLALLGFDQRQALKNIKVPTLVLSGTKDKNAPAPMMAKMASFIPSASYVELEGAGHLVNLERPRAFDAALDQFLKTTVITREATAS